MELGGLRKGSPTRLSPLHLRVKFKLMEGKKIKEDPRLQGSPRNPNSQRGETLRNFRKNHPSYKLSKKKEK